MLQPIDLPEEGAAADAWVRWWLHAALSCEAFPWDPDQKACAEMALEAALEENKS